MSKIVWKGDAVSERLAQKARNAVDLAARTLRQELRNKLSLPGTGRIYAKGKTGRGFLARNRLPFVTFTRTDIIEIGNAGRKGRRHKNLRELGFHQASAPGSPPALDTGHLKTSVDVDTTGLMEYNPRARVGTNVRYGRALEYGATGAGRSRNVVIAARPWFRPTLNVMRKRIMSILAQGMRST